MRADGCQLLWQPVQSGPRPIEPLPVYPIGDLAGPGANPLCCPLTGAGTQDMAIREASPLGYDSTLPAGGDRRGPRVCQESGPPPGTDQISRAAAPYIIALGPGGVLQGSGKIRVHRPRGIDSP